MRRLTAAAVVVVALISPAAASAQYTFGDWARDQGYSPGGVLPSTVAAGSSGIDSLDGIGEFDWATTPTTGLYLGRNQLSSIGAGALRELIALETLDLGGNELLNIEADDFSGLTNLKELYLGSNQLSSIESGDFSELTKLTWLVLSNNQLSSIETGSFSELTNLKWLNLGGNQLSRIASEDLTGLTNLTLLGLGNNQISNIESASFGDLTNLRQLLLNNNRLSSIPSRAFAPLENLHTLELSNNEVLEELNLEGADFSSLIETDFEGNVSLTSASLRHATLNQESLAGLLNGGDVPLGWTGIGLGELEGITEMDLSGIDFVNITDLEPLYAMDDLTDLWLVDTANVNANDLDVLLDNLATIEGTDTEGVLHMTRLDFIDFVVAGNGLLADWHDEPGHHVEFLQVGDVNHDTQVNGLDVEPFVDLLLDSRFDVAADMNGDGVVNGLDVAPFVAAVVGGNTQQIPEPSTLLLCVVALSVVGGWRKWGGPSYRR